ncbi:hypothetical protein CcCBS67573_g06420 [Chytriomyces confervae]|uniref:Uncharacterized protein n=1 Tax=Chytriomyces confervae TaxID=246404 RepID=A0A507F3A8_9FUNG|nr:hypothetical protein CcCBS67573_g06420 [Chytriomyces confervae]
MIDYVLFTGVCFGTALLATVHLYYMPRIFALCATLMMRLVLRDARVSVVSLSVAPLSGKLMFKGLKYSSKDLSLAVLRGHVTLRYWANKNHSKQVHPLMIRLDGFELFIFNNSPAYDHLKSILETEKYSSPGNGNLPSTHTPTIGSHPAQPRASTDLLSPNRNNQGDGAHTNQHRADSKTKAALPAATHSAFSRYLATLLPIEIVGAKGAVVVGNPDLKTLFVVDFKEARGSYSRTELAPAILQLRPPISRYNLSLNLAACKFSFRANSDFKDPLLNQAARVRFAQARQEALRRRRAWSGRTRSSSASRQQESISQDRRAEGDDVFDNTEGGVEWIGLGRYADDADTPLSKGAQPRGTNRLNAGREFSDEYARVEEAIVAESVQLDYYSEDAGIAGYDSSLPPPKWGIDLILNKSTVNYGPWTNRQRSMIQSYFFPPSYRTSKVTEEPETGYHQHFTNFLLKFKFNEGCTFRVPFRGVSKELIPTKSTADQRTQLAYQNPSWLEFKCSGPDSYLELDIPMTSPANGYCTAITFNMTDMSIATSLNYASFLQAESFHVRALMQSPLKWNGERVWNYEVNVNQGKLHFLMDHVSLLQDLGRDFSYNPGVPNPDIFVPIAHNCKLNLKDLDLYLCTNQQNVIHKATHPEENSFIILSSDFVAVSLEIPYLLYAPAIYGIVCDVTINNGKLTMSHPPSHAIGAFMKDAEKHVGEFKTLGINVNYEYANVDHPAPVANPDSLSIDVELDSAALKAYGFVINAFIDLLANYLSASSHFLGIEEYRARLAELLKMKGRNPVPEKLPPVSENDYEIAVDIKLRDSHLVLPEDLFECKTGSILHADLATIELASNSVEQDLKFLVSPVIWTRTQIPADFSVESVHDAYEMALLIEHNCVKLLGLDIFNRQLLGPQPNYKSYAMDLICHCHSISADILPPFLHGVWASLNSIMHHLRDLDDALPAQDSPPVINLVKFRVDPVKISLWGQDSVTILDVPEGIKVQYDSFITSKWTSRTLVDIPVITAKALIVGEENKTLNKPFADYEWNEVLNFETSASLGFFTHSEQLDQLRRMQREFVAREDSETLRCEHLFAIAATSSQQLNSTLFKIPVGLDYDLDYDRFASKRARAKTYSVSNARRNSDRLPKSEGASPYAHRSSSFLGSRFSLDATYKTHLRSYRGVRSKSDPDVTEFVSYHGDFETKNRSTSRRRAFPYQEIELLNNADFTESTPHSKLIVRTSECLKVLLTPFALKVVEQFIESSLEVGKNNFGSQLLDALQIYYTKLVTTPVSAAPAYTTLIISAPEVHIQSIQDMEFPDKNKSKRHDFLDSTLCAMDVQAINLLQVVNFGSKKGAASSSNMQVVDLHFSLDIEGLKTSMRFLDSMQYSERKTKIKGIPHSKQLNSEFPELPSTSPVVFDLFSSNIKILCDFEAGLGIAPSNAGVSIQSQSFEFVFVDETVEIAAGALMVWLVCAQDLYGIVNRYISQERMQLQALVNDLVLNSLKNVALRDPRFLSTPSAIWILGTSYRKHQTDPGWRMLQKLKQSQFHMNFSSLSSDAQKKRLHITDVSGNLSKFLGTRVDLAKNLLHALIFDVGPKDPQETDFIQMLSTLIPSLEVAGENVRITSIDSGSSDSVLHCRNFLIDLSSMLRRKLDIVPVKASQSPLKDSRFLDVLGVVSVAKISMTLNPNILRLFRHIARVYNRLSQVSIANTSSGQVKQKQFSQSIDFAVSFIAIVNEVTLAATANNLQMKTVLKKIGFQGNYYSKPALFRVPETLSLSGALQMKNGMFDVSETSSHGVQSLFSVQVVDVASSLAGGSHSLLGIDCVEVRLPKSLVKLQAFFEQWGNALPDYDLLINKFMKELERPSANHQKVALSLDIGPSTQNIQVVVKSFVLISDLLSNLRCRYSINNFLLLVRRNIEAGRVENMCTSRIASHKLEFEAQKKLGSLSPHEMSAYLLPTVMFEGTYETSPMHPSNLQASFYVGLVEGALDAHLIDQLLTAQSLLGSEVNDIVEMAMFYYRKRQSGMAAAKIESNPFIYSIKIRVSGIKLAADSPQSRLLLGSNVFTMQIRNSEGTAVAPTKWRLSLKSLSLEFVSNEKILARIIVDIELHNFSTAAQKRRTALMDASVESLEPVHFHVKKVLGVLHPVGMGRIIDFMLFYSKELEQRSLAKQSEIRVMKENAQRLFSSVNSVPMSNQVPDATSFFKNRNFWIEVAQVSIAIPLSDAAGEALLMCIMDMRYESFQLIENRGVIQDISVQFVENFDAAYDSSFLPTSHPVLNRFILREIEGEISQFFKEGFGEISLRAGVKGFNLDLNSSITRYINALIAIYAKEKGLFGSSFTPASYVNNLATPTHQSQNPLATFTKVLLQGELIFGAGVCRISSQSGKSQITEFKEHDRKPSNQNPVLDDSYDEQIFTVPGVGFSLSGTTVLGDETKLSQQIEKGFYITQHIYESENILHPTVLSFFIDIMSSINLDSLGSTSAEIPQANQVSNESTMYSLDGQKHTITYVLKLSQTKVSLSCLPESKVALNFVLEEANVLCSFTPKSETEQKNAINFTCAIKGMNGTLKHAFSPEDCLKWNVSQLVLTASVLFFQDSRQYSLGMDSAFIAGSLNIRQLQDLVLFQRLWIVPLLSAQTSGSDRSPVAQGASPYAAMFRLPGFGSDSEYVDSFHANIRFPQILLSADLGQAIGKASMTTSNLIGSFDIGWGNAAFLSKTLDLSLTAIQCQADGRFSGEANLIAPQLHLAGINAFDNPEVGNVITLVLFNLERVEVQLQFQYERILLLDLQPLDCTLRLVWIEQKGELILCSETSVILDSVKMIISRKTIPAFYQLLNKLQDAMEEKLNVDLSTSPPVSPLLRRTSKGLSRVLISTAANGQTDPKSLMRSVLGYRNGVKALGRAKILVRSTLMNFMRFNFRDPDCARVISKAIQINLEHEPLPDNILQERLSIQIDGVAIKKGTIRSLSPEEERMWTTLEWFSFIGSSPSKNVATIPAITVTLNTVSHLAKWQVEIAGQTDFAAQIDIALNFGLYRFLQDLFEGYDSSYKGKEGQPALQAIKDEIVPQTRNDGVEGKPGDLKVAAFQYVKGDFKFDPQLKVTGEATPRELIEWLGVNKTRMPELLYLNVTSALADAIVWKMASATDFGDKLTATPEEIERISKAMKNKEFRDLFHEYIQEISDPKNKEVGTSPHWNTIRFLLYEREIEALEADRGNNIRWVKPTPGRVLKTRFKSKPAKNSELRDIEKVFINMCTSSEIEEASIARPDETKNGERGQQWSIPYSLDAGRVDVDKSGSKCFVYDCVFNPKTYELGSKMTKFMDLLVQTSLDGVEQRFAVTLDRDVKPLYKTKYKGDIKATVIRTKTDEKNPKIEKKTSLDFIEKVQADKQQTLNQPKPQRPTPPTRTIITGNRYRAGQVASDGVDAPRDNTAAASAEAAPLQQPQRALIQELPSVPQQPAASNQPAAVPSSQSIPQTTTPTYTVTHRASLAYTNYMQTRDRSEANPPRPDALVLSIDLPKCTSAAEVSLDTVKNGWACHIHAGFSNGAGEYDVNIDLPFQVTEEGGNAQFDKARRILRVELPCVPAPREEIPLADVPFEADEVVDGGAVQTENVGADSQFENDVRDTKPVDNDAETTLVSEQETISENTLTAANTIEPEIAPLQCQQPVESNTASKAPAPTSLLQQEVSIDIVDAESSGIVADKPADIEMEDDIHAALSSLQPCVPTADELEQLAHAAVKSGMMGPSWNVKSIDDVFELALDDGNVADEAEEALTVGGPQTHVVELKKDTCLKSRLIFEMDD